MGSNRMKATRLEERMLGHDRMLVEEMFSSFVLCGRLMKVRPGKILFLYIYIFCRGGGCWTLGFSALVNVPPSV